MTIDKIMEVLAGHEAFQHDFVKDWLKTLSEQPGFLAHEDEVLAELKTVEPRNSPLGNMIQLAEASKRVMARHSLPQDFVFPSGD